LKVDYSAPAPKARPAPKATPQVVSIHRREPGGAAANRGPQVSRKMQASINRMARSLGSVNLPQTTPTSAVGTGAM
jgi:hypothetical protein